MKRNVTALGQLSAVGKEEAVVFWVVCIIFTFAELHRPATHTAPYTVAAAAGLHPFLDRRNPFAVGHPSMACHPRRIAG